MIDTYAYNNALKDVHPAEKFFLASPIVLLCLITKSEIVLFLAASVTTIATVYRAGIPLGFYLKTLCLPLSFAILGGFGVALAVVPSGVETLFGITFFGKTIGITLESLRSASLLVLKTVAAMSALFFFL
ncbi:MAG: hypothetical protein HQL06_14825 [Nitrospirae bacterium]|nr:hypothetical protein [Nitrospirota bacterium]